MYINDDGVIKTCVPKEGYKISLKGFFIIAFTLSWVGVIPMVGKSWVNESSPLWLSDLFTTLAPLQFLMFFGTLIAAFFVIYKNYGKAGLKELGKGLIKLRAPFKVWVLILIGPALLSMNALLIANKIDPSIKMVMIDIRLLETFSQLLLIQLILNTEEIAWRGYALPQLQSLYNPLKANKD